MATFSWIAGIEVPWPSDDPDTPENESEQEIVGVVFLRSQ